MSQDDLFGCRAATLPANPLEEFCAVVAGRCRRGARIAPEEMAALFRERFRLLPPIMLHDQIRLAQRLGVRHFDFVDLSPELGGCNAKYTDVYAIQVNRWHARVRQEHTIFHELYELILHRLGEVMPGVWATPDAQRERDADEFAAGVFMPAESFLKDALACGLDVVDLCRRYRRAYSSTLIHLVKSLHKIRIPVIALLYESRAYEIGAVKSLPAVSEGNDTPFSRLCLRYRWATLGLSARCNPILHSCIPPRGEGITPGTLAWLAVMQRRPIYVARMAPFDFFGGEDLAVLARPVVWRGSGVGKIIIVGVRRDQRELLAPQLQRVEHEVIDYARGFDVRPLARTIPLPLSGHALRRHPTLRPARAAIRLPR